LFKEDNKPVLQESIQWAKMPILKERYESQKGVAMTSALFPLPGLLLRFLEENNKATAQNVMNNISSKVLFDKSINRGERHSGFVYFNLKDIIADKGILSLLVKVKNLKTENSSAFKFIIDLKGLDKRIDEIKLLKEVKKDYEGR
jgi:hypothetical protein